MSASFGGLYRWNQWTLENLHSVLVFREDYTGVSGIGNEFGWLILLLCLEGSVEGICKFGGICRNKFGAVFVLAGAAY